MLEKDQFRFPRYPHSVYVRADLHEAGHEHGVRLIMQNLLERVEAWPKEAREELIRIVSEIESELGADYHTTPAELRGIDRGLRAAEAGQIASADDVAAAFGKFRHS